MSRKQIIIMISVVCAVVIFGFVVWMLISRTTQVTVQSNVNTTGSVGLPNVNDQGPVNGGVNTNTGPVNLTPENTNDALPVDTSLEKDYGVAPIASGGLTETGVVQSRQVKSPTRSASGREVVYNDPADGRFYRVREDGTRDALSDRQFFNVESVVWSPDANKAVLTFPDSTKLLYNFKTNTKLDLPVYWEDFDFSPSGSELAFKSMTSDKENRYLTTMDAEGKNINALEPLGDNEKDVEVSWSPDKQVVATYSKPLDGNRREIRFIGLNGENFKSAIVEGQGFSGTWTPDAQRLLYSTYSTTSLIPELYIVNAKGDAAGSGRRSLGLKTWADRCAFDSKGTYAYCGVPTNLQEGAAIVPQYQVNTNDNLYRINLANFQISLVARPATLSGVTSHAMTNVFLSGDDRFFYYADARTGGLYRIQLAE